MINLIERAFENFNGTNKTMENNCIIVYRKVDKEVQIFFERNISFHLQNWLWIIMKYLIIILQIVQVFWNLLNSTHSFFYSERFYFPFFKVWFFLLVLISNFEENKYEFCTLDKWTIISICYLLYFYEH